MKIGFIEVLNKKVIRYIDDIVYSYAENCYIITHHNAFGSTGLAYSDDIIMVDDVNDISDMTTGYVKVDFDNLIIPTGITAINDAAFLSCEKLKHIEIPNSVTYIGKEAFSWCRNLKNIVLSNNITAINDSTFYECKNLEKIVIPDGVTSIGNYAFDGCRNLIDISVPKSVKSIGDYGFGLCQHLDEDILPKNVKLGKNVFSQNPFD